MIDASVVSGAWNGLKFAKEALKLALDAKAESASREQVQAALDRLGQATDSLFEVREELFRLQDENRSLGDQLALSNDWRDVASAYSLVATAGGAVVYQFNASPDHYLCPSCFVKRERQILQDLGNYGGTYACPACRADYPIKRRRDPNA